MRRSSVFGVLACKFSISYAVKSGCLPTGHAPGSSRFFCDAHLGEPSIYISDSLWNCPARVVLVRPSAEVISQTHATTGLFMQNMITVQKMTFLDHGSVP